MAFKIASIPGCEKFGAVAFGLEAGAICEAREEGNGAGILAGLAGARHLASRVKRSA